MPPVHINVLLVNFSIKNYLILVGADMPIIHICMASMRYDYLCICHIMKTSSNGNIFHVTGPLWGNSPVTGEFPSQRPVTRDGVIKWKHFLRYWPLVKEIHRSAVNSPHQGQWEWCGALMFSLICAWTNGWVNNRDAGDLRPYRAHYDIIVMYRFICCGRDMLKHYMPCNCTLYSCQRLAIIVLC